MLDAMIIDGVRTCPASANMLIWYQYCSIISLYSPTDRCNNALPVAAARAMGCVCSNRGSMH